MKDFLARTRVRFFVSDRSVSDDVSDEDGREGLVREHELVSTVVGECISLFLSLSRLNCASAYLFANFLVHVCDALRSDNLVQYERLREDVCCSAAAKTL